MSDCINRQRYFAAIIMKLVCGIINPIEQKLEEEELDSISAEASRAIEEKCGCHQCSEGAIML